MVKLLDDIHNDKPAELIDHVGFRIWRLAQAWKAEFHAAMVARGHGWFAEARANLLPHLDRGGTEQSVLPGRMGVTKQAVQQFVDELVGDGILERRANPADRRSNIIGFTRKGQKVLADANLVKIAIQKRYQAKLGKDRFASLLECLEMLDSDESHARNEERAISRR
jgi:DNA-binding MarR family transcriptional regulator